MNVWIGIFSLFVVFSLPMLYVALKGKSLLERIAAVDVIGANIITSLMLFSAYTKRSVYIDIALTLALLDFIGNLAFARYIAGRWE